ncbi:SRPBCC domain-containing protein [Actinomycetota bacterium]
MANNDTCTYSVTIDRPAQEVWDELTSVGTPRPWLYGTVTESTWETGSPYSQAADGFNMIDGVVKENSRSERLAMSFNCHWDADVEGEPAGLLTYELHEAGEGKTRLDVTLTGLAPNTAAACHRDTPEIYEGLKSQLESRSA